MADYPIFPQFKSLDLADREVVQGRLWDYQPETSELTFTNLFIWRFHYHFEWCLDQDWLLLMSNSPENGVWALPPLGPRPRRQMARRLLEWLKEDKGLTEARIERADSRLVAELADGATFAIESTRKQFDYLYRSQDLINLAGRKYHAKRNHLNNFKRSYQFTYQPLEARHLPECCELADQWCVFKRCDEDLNLMGEWEAIAEALKNFEALHLQGGVILVDDRVEAFAMGERLNQDTAVVHLEKANPELGGIYAVINQQFCAHAWAQVPFINREQDLGAEGLRRAKLSYQPHRLVEKFRIRLT
ncbi:MAG: phosphatidylglycerol lysyltransferase domain-containing protein [Desulfobacca sp.]|nr:phosphatidylglycerol lysyltransferase domain-containing protein [Desulfobacca sp.]